METKVTDCIEIGKPESPHRRLKQSAYVGAAALLLVLGLPEQLTQSDVQRHDSLADASGSVLNTEHNAYFPFEPGHRLLIFSPMGAGLTTMPGGNSTAALRPVGVSFTAVHCEKHQVYANTEVDLSQDSMLLIERASLPINSLTFDCFLDNQLAVTNLRQLTMSDAAYPYEAHMSPTLKDK